MNRYRKFLILLLILDVAAIMMVSFYDIKSQIPDDYYTFVETRDELNLPLPVQIEGSVPALNIRNAGNGIHVNSKQKGEYQVDVKLFGMISMKKMNVHVWEKTKLAPCGLPIGIYVATKGLLVLDTGAVEGKDDVSHEPSSNILQPGDYILKWNKAVIKSTSQMNDLVEHSKGKPATLIVKRNHQNITVRITPILSKKGVYKIGVWVREDTQGIGTLTYVTKTGGFGALGHGITDSDTGSMIQMKAGDIYSAKILNIIKGKAGLPGELEGVISMTKQNFLGKITKNTAYGIYGNVTEAVQNRMADQFIEIAMKQKIRKGKAVILTWMEGIKKEYEIEITDINLASKDNKGMIIHITDSELLKKSGGIVQGMSGAPIIQNGKFIGAVTHVFVNDPTKGYGIFAETMLEQE